MKWTFYCCDWATVYHRLIISGRVTRHPWLIVEPCEGVCYDAHVEKTGGHTVVGHVPRNILQSLVTWWDHS